MRILRRLLLRCPRLALLALAATLAGPALPPADAASPDAKLEIRHGDHIAIIGNTLADRMQHDGWLEAYVVSRFPKHDLVLRNLGFSADELTIRLRSAGFGTPDQWLTATETDVILAFFGYNESFQGQEGLATFKKDLEDFITATLAQKYHGESRPGWSSSRPSPTRTCTTATCPTAPRITRGSHSTPTPWPRSPGPTMSPSWTCSDPPAPSSPRRPSP